MAAKVDSETIHAELRAEILHGSHAPGTAFKEVALADRFGVSRTPVREALGRLAQEGLLERGVRGLQVRNIDPEQLMQVYDLRILLEGQAALEAAATRTEMDLIRLEGLVDRDRALPDPDDQTRLRTNIEFHSALWTAAHNPILKDLLDRLSTHQIHAPSSTLSVGARWADSLDEHAEMVRLIRNRDGAEAQEAMRRHMGEARRIRLSLFGQIGLPNG
ncbi:GntR family transcriptional regulator [Paeniglutamicibacter sulfureus]|uniref:DNA-binding GntR family transcriptional regulator n=2 Tax=Paeniglutamicibacter sulfureus TaxID=43666 RepID=A0ABU2BL30_9MICC|nr:GntR family transcriptional regulator [Paeniglutamicibacter sulfureus]MDR7358694.1 DNA-binding GntR family transcriptional regulator [Paeniglutamicibacter sulfureus]